MKNPFPARCFLCVTRAETIGAVPPVFPSYADAGELEAHITASHPPAQMVMLLSWAMAKADEVPA